MLDLEQVSMINDLKGMKEQRKGSQIKHSDKAESYVSSRDIQNNISGFFKELMPSSMGKAQNDDVDPPDLRQLKSELCRHLLQFYAEFCSSPFINMHIPAQTIS